MAAKKDPSVLVGGSQLEESMHVPHVTNSVENHDRVKEKSRTGHFKWSKWNSPSVHDPYVKNKDNVKLRDAYFSHITNFVARNHWEKCDQDLLPSKYLNLEITAEQKKNLNPTLKQVLVGSLTDEVMGVGAKRKLAKRRLEMIEGNVSSYSRIINDSEQLNQLKEWKKIHATVALIQEEREEKKELAREEKRKKEEEKDRKKKEAVEKLAKERAESIPKLQPHVSKGLDHMKTQTNDLLREFLKLWFEKPSTGLAKMAKPALVAEIELRWEEAQEILAELEN